MTTSLRFGTVVWLRFPYVDQDKSKTAPAVVLSTSQYQASCDDVIVARVTTNLQITKRFGSVIIQNQAACGLTKPSVIKPVVMTVAQSDIVATLGTLDEGTLLELKLSFKNVFGFS